jgi:hypothetical protein
MLTVHGIECAFSLPLDQDRVPITLQVLEVESITSDSSLSPVRVEVTFSDGVHRSPMILSRRLNHLASELHQGDIVTLTNYISQRLDDNKLVVICLDVAVVTASEDIIGNPSDFVLLSADVDQPIDFIGTTVVGLCNDCQQNPCDWSLFGPSIVDCIRSTISNTPSVDRYHTNKQCRFAAYQMYTRAKLGYLGKGNRVQLPQCVSTGVRNNFPDPNNSYVGFVPGNNE